jgi:transcriptional regulator with XRE-family HTH domain
VSDDQDRLQQFGKRLYRLMLKKGWTQSELSRQADLPRDSISRYIRGRSEPNPQSLQNLATALDVKPDDLLPGFKAPNFEDVPVFEMKQISTPGIVRLRMDRLVTLSAAARIADILANDAIAEQK